MDEAIGYLIVFMIVLAAIAAFITYVVLPILAVAAVIVALIAASGIIFGFLICLAGIVTAPAVGMIRGADIVAEAFRLTPRSKPTP